METIDVLSIGSGITDIIDVEELANGRYRATFPEETRYNYEVEPRSEEVKPISGIVRPEFDDIIIHHWMLPSGYLLVYREESAEELAFIKRVYGENAASFRSLVIHESPDARASSAARGWRTWDQEFGF